MRFIESEQKGTHWSKLTDVEKQLVRDWYGRKMVDSEHDLYYYSEHGKIIYAN